MASYIKESTVSPALLMFVPSKRLSFLFDVLGPCSVRGTDNTTSSARVKMLSNALLFQATLQAERFIQCLF